MSNENEFNRGLEEMSAPTKITARAMNEKNNSDLDSSRESTTGVTGVKQRVPLWIKVVGIFWCFILIVLVIKLCYYRAEEY